VIRYHARWVLPISRPPIERGTVVEHEGRIVYAGPRAGAPPGEDRDLGDAYLLPGLVNAHTHLELTAFHGLITAPSFREWIVALQAAKTAVMTRDRFLDSARAGIADGLRAGITTYADTCDSGVALEAMREAGVRGIMYQEVFGPSPDPAAVAESMRGLEQKLATLDPLATGLVRVGVSPHAPYTVSDPLFALVAHMRRPVAIHIAESEEETVLVRDGAGPFAEALRKRGIPVTSRAISPIALLEQLGVLSARPLLIHCIRASNADLRMIAAHDCAVAHCPASNTRLGHGIAPLPAMLALGIRTGLGSDSMASNDAMDILEEARRAAALQRGAITAARSLELATLGGARALDLADRIGTLEPGKDADLAAFPMQPGDPADPVAALATPRAALAAIVAGAPILWDATLRAADPALPTRLAQTSAALRAYRDSRNP
jgi:5-methylthioadenosine/S-adenosylhomocysteine deaminase